MRWCVPPGMRWGAPYWDDVLMRTVEISEEPIRLGQFLKLAQLAEDGGHAKELIEDGEVHVNGGVEVRRGAQLREGDIVVVGSDEVRISVRR
jgi:ribosome-associated protein